MLHYLDFDVPLSFASLTSQLKWQSPPPVFTDFWGEIPSICPARDSVAFSDLLWLHLLQISFSLLWRNVLSLHAFSPSCNTPCWQPLLFSHRWRYSSTLWCQPCPQIRACFPQVIAGHLPELSLATTFRRAHRFPLQSQHEWRWECVWVSWAIIGGLSQQLVGRLLDGVHHTLNKLCVPSMLVLSQTLRIPQSWSSWFNALGWLSISAGSASGDSTNLRSKFILLFVELRMQNPPIWRTKCTAPLPIRDLSIPVFWCPQWLMEPISRRWGWERNEPLQQHQQSWGSQVSLTGSLSPKGRNRGPRKISRPWTLTPWRNGDAGKAKLFFLCYWTQVRVPDTQWGQTDQNVGVWCRERFISGPCKEMGGLWPKHPKLLKWFQQSIFKGKVSWSMVGC